MKILIMIVITTYSAWLLGSGNAYLLEEFFFCTKAIDAKECYATSTKIEVIKLKKTKKYKKLTDKIPFLFGGKLFWADKKGIINKKEIKK